MLQLLILKYLRHIQGKVNHQRFLGEIHELTLAGMNFGGGSFINGSFIQESGEKNIIKMVARIPKIKEAVIFDVGANVGNLSLELINRDFSGHLTKGWTIR